MLFFINADSPETTTYKQNRLKALVFAIAISTLPVGAYFSSKKVLFLEDSNSLFISIIIGTLVLFVGSSSTIGVGINRTKGDKKTYE